MVDDPAYIHGVHPEEQQRLSDLNALVNEHSLAAMAPRAGERMLELGAGLGELARAVGGITAVPVVGVERSAAQLERARELARRAGEGHLVDLRQGDALAPPLGPDEWGSFDIVHARFLLEHVADPAQVVAVMARAVRAGGRVILEDDDHDALRIWPEPPGVMLVWRAYIRTYDRLGNDPFVGRRLVQLLAQAGLAPRRSALLPFGACSGDARFPAYVRNLANVFRGASEAILATSGVTAGELAAALDALEAFERRDDAVFWYTINWAEGTRP